MRPNTRSLPLSSLRAVTLSVSLAALSMTTLPCRAELRSTTCDAVDTTTSATDVPPPFIETTGHGLVSTTQTNTSLSTSSNTSSSSLMADTSSVSGSTPTKSSPQDALTSFERWLYEVLGLAGE